MILGERQWAAHIKMRIVASNEHRVYDVIYTRESKSHSVAKGWADFANHLAKNRSKLLVMRNERIDALQLIRYRSESTPSKSDEAS